MRDVAPPDAFLHTLIAESGGSIPVERFMREALYHPAHGYYSARVREVGERGDFSTSATLHRALGRAIAGWAAAHRGEVKHGGRWHLIELGGGNGELAEEVRRSLGWRAGWGVQYHLVEVSSALRAGQQQRLERWRGTRWHTETGSALEAAGGRALIFSNEFVDAFPCVQLRRAGITGLWSEVSVAWPEQAEHPVEVLTKWNPPGPESDFPPASALTGTVASKADQRVEVHFSYQRWLAAWQRHWKAGRLLTIDYGDLMPAVYHRRPQGTLRAYCRHQRFDGPEVYRRFGRQDLTADVNFTDLEAWGEALGWKTDRFCTQAEFLGRWLPRGWLASAAREPALAYLLDPRGAGQAFKVLDQIRSIG